MVGDTGVGVSGERVCCEAETRLQDRVHRTFCGRSVLAALLGCGRGGGLGRPRTLPDASFLEDALWFQPHFQVLSFLLSHRSYVGNNCSWLPLSPSLGIC